MVEFLKIKINECEIFMGEMKPETSEFGSIGILHSSNLSHCIIGQIKDG